MSQESKATRILIAAIVWLVIIVILAVSYKFLVRPFFSERLEGDTGSESQYEHTVKLAADSFSGYSILRSPVIHDLLKEEKIRLDIDDDSADYLHRIKALKKGDLQMAVFTIDSLLAAGANLGDFPASIVLVLDETKGADGIVAYSEGIANIQDMDNPDARFVLTPDSPSEFLARTVLAHFSLPSLPAKWMMKENGAKEVYATFRSATKTDKRAYVLWEPYLSKALQEQGAHILLDSSNMKGYIVDVLVAERRFLSDFPEVAAKVVESYLRAAYSYRAREGAMVQLVMDDAKNQGDKLQREQAEKLVAGIHWKTTLENYAHFGIQTGLEMGGAQHLEDIIPSIAEVLVQTKKLTSDPLENRANTLFYDKILRDLVAQDFEPARKKTILAGVDTGPNSLGAIEKARDLPTLSLQQWQNLVPVGKLRVKNIAFGRGTAKLNVQSERELAALAKRMLTLPRYYVLVMGHARAEGDPEANQLLAQQRAEAAVRALTSNGVQSSRVKAKAIEPSASNGSAQSVSFLIGTPPY